MDPQKLSELIRDILDSKKAHDVQILHVGDKTTLAEYFVVADGSSVTQVKALEDELTYRLKEEAQILPVSEEGESSGKWVLIDYGSVVVHIFKTSERQFYDLEQFWKSKHSDISLPVSGENA